MRGASEQVSESTGTSGSSVGPGDALLRTPATSPNGSGVARPVTRARQPTRRIEALAAYGITLLILTVVPISRAMQESGLPLTSLTGHDFGAYYQAARAVQAGESPYFRETVAGPFVLNSWYYIYPPPVAGILLPLAYLPPYVANIVWTLLLAAGMLIAGATVAGAGNPLRARPPTAVAITLALGLSVPGISGMGQGAVSCLLGTLILAVVLARSQPISGVAAALAALVKIEPALWGAYLAGAGRVRAIMIAAATGAGIVAAMYALPGVRAGWAEYPTVLANATASSRSVPGSGSIGALLNLSPGSAHTVEVAVLGLALLAMLLAGRLGLRFAPLASSVGILATPTLWGHAAFLVVPLALAVIALGSGIVARVGVRRASLSGPRLAEVVAAIFCFGSYTLFLVGLDPFMIYLLVVPIAAAAAWWGPRTQ